jgi:hypothetical protein
MSPFPPPKTDQWFGRHLFIEEIDGKLIFRRSEKMINISVVFGFWIFLILLRPIRRLLAEILIQPQTPQTEQSILASDMHFLLRSNL